jgi:hypothetical protein
MTPAMEFRNPGLELALSQIVSTSQSLSSDLDSHEDAVYEPDIIMLPFKPQPAHPGGADSTTRPCDRESGKYQNSISHSLSNDKTYKETFFTWFNICSSVPSNLSAGTSWMLENVPGNRTKPARTIHVKKFA